MVDPHGEKYTPVFTETLNGDHVVTANAGRLHTYFRETLIGLFDTEPQPPHVSVREGVLDGLSPLFSRECRKVINSIPAISRYCDENDLQICANKIPYSHPIGTPRVVQPYGYDATLIARRVIPIASNPTTHNTVAAFLETDVANPYSIHALDGDMVTGGPGTGIQAIYEVSATLDPITSNHVGYRAAETKAAIKRVMHDVATLTLGAGYRPQVSEGALTTRELPQSGHGLYL